MPKYQFKREPLTQDEATRLANACETPLERLIIWTILDTGLRVSELVGLQASNIDWQGRRLIVYGKGGPFGSKSKRRVVPMTDRIGSIPWFLGAQNRLYMLGVRERFLWHTLGMGGQDDGLRSNPLAGRVSRCTTAYRGTAMPARPF